MCEKLDKYRSLHSLSFFPLLARELIARELGPRARSCPVLCPRCESGPHVGSLLARMHAAGRTQAAQAACMDVACALDAPTVLAAKRRRVEHAVRPMVGDARETLSSVGDATRNLYGASTWARKLDSEMPMALA